MMGILSLPLLICLVITFSLVVLDSEPACSAPHAPKYISALGDPGMRETNARFGLEAWNSCNEVGEEAPNMGSPRLADCADLHCPDIDSSNKSCVVNQHVQDKDNNLKAGNEFPGGPTYAFNSSRLDVDNYAVQKELYLGSLCDTATPGSNQPWQFWMIMLKNGNLNTSETVCPENGKKVKKTVTDRHFPCFGERCMNQPLVYRNESRVVYDSYGNASLAGGFYGTYDVNANVSPNSSFFGVTWQKNTSTNGWIVSFKLTTSANYPWLMLYLRADATKGYNGGYHYDGRGIMRLLPESPHFKVKLTLDIKKGGGGSSQFYLSDIGGCWKNNGQPCDGNVTTDVTRYSEMIINPGTGSSCRVDNLRACPPHHISITGEVIHRNDTARFPYSAYHYYCGPGNAEFLEEPSGTCDPFSNPQAQELVQILPHPEWGVHGYPTKQGEGWESGPRTWVLDTGALSNRLFFYQDPGTTPAKRVWRSINCGTEMYFGRPGDTAEWSVSDFDVLVPKPKSRKL